MGADGTSIRLLPTRMVQLHVKASKEYMVRFKEGVNINFLRLGKFMSTAKSIIPMHTLRIPVDPRIHTSISIPILVSNVNPIHSTF